MQKHNRYCLIAYVLFFIVYWLVSCPLFRVYIRSQHKNSSFWMPYAYWGAALALFIVLTLFFFFVGCRSRREKSSSNQMEHIKSFECERQGTKLDDLKMVDLNRSSLGYSFIEQTPPRYVNVRDIIDERRPDSVPFYNDTMTAMERIKRKEEQKAPNSVLKKPPPPLRKFVPKSQDESGSKEETVITEKNIVTCIPITTDSLPSLLQKTEVFLYINKD